MRDSVCVYVDRRENRSGVLPALERRGVDVVLEDLPVGDYILSERVGVERKTASDFLGSITGKRLYRQIARLRESFDAPLLIIEGHNLYGLRAIYPDVIRRALALITVSHRLPVVFTRDEEDTAGFLYAVARQEQLELERGRPSLRGEKIPLLMEERQRYVVEGFPGIGPEISHRLLEHFGTIEKLARATEEELCRVQGVGPGRARRIREILSARYPHGASE